METNIDEQISLESFEYGNHTVEIEVRIIKTYVTYIPNYIHKVKDKGAKYHRKVIVRCFKIDEYGEEEENNNPDVKNTTLYILGEEEVTEENSQGNPWNPFSSGKEEVVYYENYTLREQIRTTCKCVFEELDTMYQFTTDDISIDVEVTLDELEAESSWVEIEDEIDRISNEIEEIASI